MTEMKHTRDDLSQMQSLPLETKVKMSKYRIREWYEHWNGEVYISFSGGKDSTVLLDLVRNVCGYKNVPCVYVDTGLEYPEIREFVKGVENVIWLKPKMNFKKVIEKYGYPFISKEVSQTLYEIKTAKDKGKDYKALSQYKRLMGEYMVNGKKAFTREKYKFFMNEGAPKISSKCCRVMKKDPVHRFYKKTGLHPITGQMACESVLRKSVWLKNGCNAFDSEFPISNPMSFWTEQDVLRYIKENNLPLCSVYGDIVEKDTQISFFDDTSVPELVTTGCERTGCVFCGYGCHLKNDQRFVRLKTTHPKIYEYIMKSWDEGGLGYKEIIDWINKNGNLRIKY